MSVDFFKFNAKNQNTTKATRVGIGNIVSGLKKRKMLKKYKTWRKMS